MAAEDIFSLRQVVELTGLSEFTLRAWENRYQAFSPARTPTGRRIYSAQDLQRAMLLRDLVHAGHKISEVAVCSLKQLQRLRGTSFKIDSQPEIESGPSPKASSCPGVVARVPVASPPRAPKKVKRAAFDLEKFRHAALSATIQEDWDELRTICQMSGSDPKRSLLWMTEFAIPYMQELGVLVSRGKLTIAQEHIASALLKGSLYQMQAARARSSKRARTRFKILITSPEGDFHELGILAAHTIAVQCGMDSLYLGPNTPKAELCESALRFGARAVVIGTTVARSEGAKDDILTYLHFLNRHLPAKVEIWLGGRNSMDVEAVLKRRFTRFESLRDFEARLRSLVRR